MNHFDPFFMQALIDAANKDYKHREEVKRRVALEPFLDPFTTDDQRWINDQLVPHRSKRLAEPAFTVANMFEYVFMLDRFIGEDGFYKEILDGYQKRCTPGELQRLQTRLNNQGKVMTAAWEDVARKRESIEWSTEELDALDTAVAELGYNWKAIKAKYPQLAARSNGMQLRDKCLQIKRRAIRNGHDLRTFKDGIYFEQIPGKEVGQIAKISRKRTAQRDKKVLKSILKYSTSQV